MDRPRNDKVLIATHHKLLEDNRLDNYIGKFATFFCTTEDASIRLNQ